MISFENYIAVKDSDAKLIPSTKMMLTSIFILVPTPEWLWKTDFGLMTFRNTIWRYINVIKILVSKTCSNLDLNLVWHIIRAYYNIILESMKYDNRYFNVSENLKTWIKKLHSTTSGIYFLMHIPDARPKDRLLASIYKASNLSCYSLSGQRFIIKCMFYISVTE